MHIQVRYGCKIIGPVRKPLESATLDDQRGEGYGRNGRDAFGYGRAHIHAGKLERLLIDICSRRARWNSAYVHAASRSKLLCEIGGGLGTRWRSLCQGFFLASWSWKQ
jgi:hypothetical protein